MNFQYKRISVPVGFEETALGDTSKSVQEIIHESASGGWRLVSMPRFDFVRALGCLEVILIIPAIIWLLSGKQPGINTLRYLSESPGRILMRLLLSVCFIVTATVALPHPGAIDANGGHHDRRTGRYHYHRGGSTSHAPAIGSTSPPTPEGTLRARGSNIPGVPLRWTEGPPGTLQIPEGDVVIGGKLMDSRWVTQNGYVVFRNEVRDYYHTCACQITLARACSGISTVAECRRFGYLPCPQCSPDGTAMAWKEWSVRKAAAIAAGVTSGIPELQSGPTPTPMSDDLMKLKQTSFDAISALLNKGAITKFDPNRHEVQIDRNYWDAAQLDAKRGTVAICSAYMKFLTGSPRTTVICRPTGTIFGTCSSDGAVQIGP